MKRERGRVGRARERGERNERKCTEGWWKRRGLYRHFGYNDSIADIISHKKPLKQLAIMKTIQLGSMI